MLFLTCIGGCWRASFGAPNLVTCLFHSYMCSNLLTRIVVLSCDPTCYSTLSHCRTPVRLSRTLPQALPLFPNNSQVGLFVFLVCLQVGPMRTWESMHVQTQCWWSLRHIGDDSRNNTFCPSSFWQPQNTCLSRPLVAITLQIIANNVYIHNVQYLFVAWTICAKVFSILQLEPRSYFESNSGAMASPPCCMAMTERLETYASFMFLAPYFCWFVLLGSYKPSLKHVPTYVHRKLAKKCDILS